MWDQERKRKGISVEVKVMALVQLQITQCLLVIIQLIKFILRCINMFSPVAECLPSLFATLVLRMRNSTEWHHTCPEIHVFRGRSTITVSILLTTLRDHSSLICFPNLKSFMLIFYEDFMLHKFALFAHEKIVFKFVHHYGLVANLLRSINIQSNFAQFIIDVLLQCLPSVFSDSAVETAADICSRSDNWCRVWLTLQHPNPSFSSQCWSPSSSFFPSPSSLSSSSCLPPVLTPSERANIESQAKWRPDYFGTFWNGKLTNLRIFL